MVQHFSLMICMLSNTFKINCATDRQITHSSAIIICLMFYLYNSNCLFSEKKKCAFESRHTAFITFLLLELPQHIRHFFLNDSFLLGEHADSKQKEVRRGVGGALGRGRTPKVGVRQDLSRGDDTGVSVSCE